MANLTSKELLDAKITPKVLKWLHYVSLEGNYVLNYNGNFTISLFSFEKLTFSDFAKLDRLFTNYTFSVYVSNSDCNDGFLVIEGIKAI